MPCRTSIRFGPYELDLDSGELSKDGTRLRIQDQPLKVLRVLLEHPGELVTREQLKQVIGPNSTFGDFDHALNVAIAKLRTALNDPAEHPVYIETLHKRGYRFIAPVNGNNNAAAIGVPSAGPATLVVVEPQRRRLSWWIASGIAMLLLAGGVVILWPQSSSPAVYEPVDFTTVQGQARQPAFSPDGSEIAFTWQSDPSVLPRIYVQSMGSVVMRQMTGEDEEANRVESMPRWFHDGSRIAYLRRVGSQGPPEVWTVARSGGPPRKLAELGPLLCFDIAPDDKSIVTSEGLPLHAYALFLTRLDRKGERRQLTSPVDKQWALSDLGAGDQFPLFSPDGKTIAYFHVEGATMNLSRIPTAGGEPERLLDDVSNTAAQVPSYTWAADGKSLIVVAVRHQNPSWGRLWLRGKRWEPLGITGTSYPTIPRHGGRLAFVRRSSVMNVWRYDLRPGHGIADGSNVTRSRAEDRGPSLSPDGNWLTFASNRTGNFEIFVSASDGSHPIQLTSFGAKDTGSPRWSPDGKQIAFDYRPDAHSRVFVVDANGGPARQLTFGEADDVMPRYSRDGQWIYFGRLHGGGSDEWKIPSGGGESVFVVDDSWRVHEAFDGKTLFIQHVHRKGIYVRSLSGGEERLLFEPAKDTAMGPWVVVGDGIYYQQRALKTHQLVFYHFATRSSRVLLQFPFPAREGTAISVSPDRRYYFEHRAEPQSNIMLIENFR